MTWAVWPVLMGWLSMSQLGQSQNDALQAVLAQSTAQRQATATALGQDSSTDGIRILWLLAHDSELEVRMAALSSALERCPKEQAGTCLGLLGFFNESRVSPGASAARDVLLHDDRCAQAETLTSSKLELIARLTAWLDRPRAPLGCRRALRLMAEDEDIEVSQTASAVLMALDR